MLFRSQRVSLDTDKNCQVWALKQEKKILYILVQEIIDGKLLFQHGFWESDTMALTAQETVAHVSRQLAEKQNEMPDFIVCDESIAAHLKQLSKTPIRQPKRGEMKALLEQAQKNASLAIKRLSLEQLSVPMDIVEETRWALKLTESPTVILGVDISHLQGEDIVGAMVGFRDGKPDKKLYRHFKVRSVSQKSNDPKSIFEVVTRGLSLYLEQHNHCPQLILIDGGRAQLNFAQRALEALGLSDQVELRAIAKRNEDIYSAESRDILRLPKESKVLHLLQYIRDESHRFALSFQRKRRRANFF